MRWGLALLLLGCCASPPFRTEDTYEAQRGREGEPCQLRDLYLPGTVRVTTHWVKRYKGMSLAHEGPEQPLEMALWLCADVLSDPRVPMFWVELQ